METIINMETIIKIEGQIQGTIWMPPVEAIKEFEEVFIKDSNRPVHNEWINLREALLRITNCGDFQSCKISGAYITTIYKKGNKRISVCKEINRNSKFISDLFCKEEDILYFDLEEV